jgi:hypothetical protein
LPRQILPKTVAAGEWPTAGTPLMEHPALIHQPIVSNKLSCGWALFTLRRDPIGRSRDCAKIKVDQWRFNV